MAHRGRLNVLVNVLGKSPQDLFSEFEGAYDLARLKGSGDVKYHKGYSADVRTPGGNVHIALAFNPSHLEIVNPVVEGSVRARQDRRGDSLGEQVLPGADPRRRGVRGPRRRRRDVPAVADACVLYGRHGPPRHQQSDRLHDERSADSRSTTYCSDIAKMVEAPGVPRERRRSRSRRGGGAARVALSAGVPQGRRHRSRRLSPPRSQRGRRAVGDAADDVRRDPRASEHARVVRAQAHGRAESSRRKASTSWPTTIAPRSTKAATRIRPRSA